jgi:hypothetical protein
MRVDELTDDLVAEIAARVSEDARRWLTLMNVIGNVRLGQPIDPVHVAIVLGLYDARGKPDAQRLVALESEFALVASQVQASIQPRIGH